MKAKIKTSSRMIQGAIKTALELYKKEVRNAVADYMKSEGCTCCQDYEAHKIHHERLGKLLDVPTYSDGSGHDFSKFRSV